MYGQIKHQTFIKKWEVERNAKNDFGGYQCKLQKGKSQGKNRKINQRLSNRISPKKGIRFFISFVLFALLLLGTFLGKSNPSFGLLGAFLLIGALNGVEREMSARIAKILLVKQKNYEKGLPVVKIACSENMPVHRVVSKISPDKLTEIEILYKTGDKKCVSEEDFLRFAEISSPKRAIGEI